MRHFKAIIAVLLSISVLSSTVWAISDADKLIQLGMSPPLAKQIASLATGVVSQLTITTSASRIVPGATSLSLRNNANSADNVLVSNAGAVTIRAGETITAGGFTLSAGDATVTAGNLIFGAASAKVIPGATSLLFRNNADSSSNLAVTDAGALTVRAGVTVTASDVAVTAGNLTFGAASAKIVPGATSLLLRNNADSASNLSIVDAGTATFRDQVSSTGLLVPAANEEAVAGAGTTVADAAALSATKHVHQLTGANGTVGWKFASATTGQMEFLLNTTAGVPKVYAVSGGTCNGGGADVACTLVTGIVAHICYATAANAWICS